MEFLLFIVIICLIILFLNHSSLKKEHKIIQKELKKNSAENHYLKRDIEEIKKQLAGQATPIAPTIVTPEILKEAVAEVITAPIPETVPEIADIHSPVITTPEATAVPIIEAAIEIPITRVSIPAQEEVKPVVIAENRTLYQPKPQQKVKSEPVESAFSIFLKNAEKQFADNWTGILGTAIMVLGIGYLSIYTALKVSPLFRILILWLYAAALVGSHYLLHTKEKWAKTGLWLRSAGASLFLFGCFGASQIDALSFITNTALGYALIGLGIGVNLYIGYIIKKQTFLSLHVVLSMLILCVIPEKLLLSFMLAAITCTIGIILSYKEKWEYHLLTTISAFIVFDIWFTAEGTILTRAENVMAILGIILVAGSCLYMQYRKIYEKTHFEKAAFITHLINWILFGVGLLLHSTGNPYKAFILMGASVLCFALAFKARKRKIYWLYHLDGMVSFILLSLSIILLNDLHVGVDIIACILYSLTTACLLIAYREKETLLHQIFLGINHVMAAVLIFFTSFMVNDFLRPEKITSTVLSVSVLSLLSLAVPVFIVIKKEYTSADAFFGYKNLSLHGLLSIVLTVFLFVSCNDRMIGNSFFYIVIAAALAWGYLKKRFELETFDIGRLFFFAVSTIVGLILLKTQEKSYVDIAFTLGLLAVIAFNWTAKRFYNNEFIIRFLGIIGANMVLLVLVYKYLLFNTQLQIFSLFGIGLLNYEFLWFHFKRKPMSSYLEFILYAFYYFFVILGSLLFLTESVTFSNLEIGFTCLGLSAIEGYVLLGKRWKNKSDETLGIWSDYHLLNSELLLFNALVFGFSCLKIEFTTVFLAAVGIASLLGFQKMPEFKRYSHYSFLLLGGSIILSLYLASTYHYNILNTLLYGIQAASILLSVGYSYLLYGSDRRETAFFNSALPYIQNSWIILLFFIQVEVRWLPLLFMGLAFLNFWLITNKKISSSIHTVTAIGLLSVVISVFYSVVKFNDFDIIAWIVELSAVALGVILTVFMHTKEEAGLWRYKYQTVLNIWLSVIMFTQLEHQWLPVYWAVLALLNVYLYFRKVNQEKNTSLVYYALANFHLAFLSFAYYETRFLALYLLIFVLLAVYIYLAYRWMEEFKLRNSILIYPATISIGCFLYFTFDKGILTFFWILEALGILILGIALKEKYFRYVSLLLVGICVIRLMFFDLSNADFLIRALVLVGVGVVLIIMNTLFKKYKERFD